MARPPLGARALTFTRTLPDHALLDRLIRGRAWIAVLGFLLAGIVAMQVEVLKLGASMGRAIERSTLLQGRNESLRASVAALADDGRIERLAARHGMVMPAPADVGFLPTGTGAQVQAAVGNIHAPSPTSFLALNTANGAVTTGTGTAGTMVGNTPGASSTSAAGISGGTTTAVATGAATATGTAAAVTGSSAPAAATPSGG